MTASRGVLGSATFLVAVSGLLDPPLVPPNGLSPLRPSAPNPPPSLFQSDTHRGYYCAGPLASTARRRKRCLQAGNESPGTGGEGVNAAAGGRRHGSGHSMFDADAWKNMPSSPPPVTAPPTSLNPSAVQLSSNDALDGEGEEEREEPTNVDVEKLPTFVFFVRDKGRHRREEVIGGRDARTCATELSERLASISSPGSTWTNSGSLDDNDSPLRPSGAGEGGVGGGAARTSSDGAAVVGGAAEGPDRLDYETDTGMGRGSGDMVANVDGTGNPTNIVEISDKRDLLRVLGALGEGQGPVVVMYHAPWCRKCAYLTPVFRRLAAAQAPSAGVREGGGSSIERGSSEGPLFCRVDVSHPSWGRRRAVRGASVAPSTVASAGTAAAAAAATAVAARAPNTAAIAAGASSQAQGLGFGDRAAGWVAADATTATAEAEGTIAETELLHAGSQAVENCDVCGGSGFVPCEECGGRGAVSRASPDGKHTMAVTCPSCVGYKRLRCPSCGGKCYMCD
ncbi:serine/threonine protein kinase [Ectocarpus siliculosus]|uniref:Serine/threonine protein kinase n=1 Tax=Ectocarpus siliculosus TaxID=2880 RepID=D7FW10_ECTSI|nr:serine/threonine protein kinase [Ectocarpus siliculosus]|eukprot:CBJ25530.1 serine/threonine protein kinase [Ectocarpus siliculosus]